MRHWKGGIILCGSPTRKIWINPWKVLDGNCDPSVKNCIALAHAYTWYILRVILILTYPSLYYSPPLYPPISLIISYKEINRSLLFYYNQTRPIISHIQPLNHFWNHAIHKSLFPTPNTFSSRQKSHMRSNVCEGMHSISRIPWMPHWW